MDIRPPKLNAQIYAEACDWFVEFRDRELDDAARREFDRWLRVSPEHLSAYLEIAAVWSEAPALDPQQRWTREKLIEEAGPGRDNVIPFVAGRSNEPANPPASRTSTRRIRTAIAVVGVALGLGAVALLEMSRATTYDTVVGEQRSVALPDGSTVDLNSRSRIEVRYSARSRNIELLAGQALFNVATDQARPFVVTSGNTRVRAVGTQFDVYKKRGGTVVTVVEGRVAIVGDLDSSGTLDTAAPGRMRVPVSQGTEHELQQHGRSAEIVLTAGGQVLVTDRAIQEPARPNIPSAIAWRQRRLVFDSAPLAEVAEEFNRYNIRQLVIQDPDLQAFHISGVFSSTDPASLIRFLRERPEVQVIETTSEIRVTKSSR
jgi:transmembrane sensor